MINNRENIPGINNGFGVESDAETTLGYAFQIANEAAPPQAKQGKEIMVGPANEIPPGGKKIVKNGILSSIGVFNIAGKFYAIKNLCPHAGAPLCEGHIQTTHRPGEVNEFHPALEGRVLRCPWHGWEFDIVTGKGLYDRTSRVATYPVKIDENGNVIVLL
jgi:3-phenylpropionate/trans-cinnamate dioxygenase ferredoxin subunit